MGERTDELVAPSNWRTVDLISDQYGVTKREAETCITKWQQNGYLVTEAGKFHGKASGLRVVKYLEPER